MELNISSAGRDDNRRDKSERGELGSDAPPCLLTPAQTLFLESAIDGFNSSEWRVELAGQAASARRFFRVIGGASSYILVEWDGGDEDWPRFLEIAAYVCASGSEVLPQIFASDPAHGLILEEDLGAMTLKEFCVESYQNGMILSDNTHDIRMICPIEAIYRQVIDAMCLWHELDVTDCPSIVSRSMDLETFLWESGYFARHCAIEFCAREELLSYEWESERKRMAERAAALPKRNMHRDFQSENIMLHGGRIRFVDFQGARLGPAHYDAASLLFDPYVELGSDITERLLDYYFSKYPFPDRDSFYICAAQRLMQALGAYSNLSLHKGKPRYRQFIPAALGRLSNIFNNYLPDYPAMREVVNACGECL